MENNLGFRVKRRRFIIETVNGDDPVGPEEPKKAVEEKVVVVEDKDKELTGELRPSKIRTEESKSSRPLKPVSIAAVMHKTPELYEF